jgi:hypothetical protein
MATADDLRSIVHDEVGKVLRSGEFQLDAPHLIGNIHDDHVSILRSGEFHVVDRVAALSDLVASMPKPLSADEIETLVRNVIAGQVNVTATLSVDPGDARP